MAYNDQFVPQFVALLVKRSVVSQEEATAMQEAFKKASQAAFDDFLLEERLVSRDGVLAALSDYYQVPSFAVSGYMFDRHLLQMFPKSLMLRNAFIPLERDQNMLIVVASQPNDPELLPKIGEHVSYDIRFRVGIRPDICNAVKEFYDKAVTEDAENENASAKPESKTDES